MALADKATFGIGIPSVFVDEPVNTTLIRDVAQRTEELGYESLWTQEQIVGQAITLEPVSLLSYVASVTSRLQLGTSVFILPHRNPMQLAKSLTTLDHLSNGRLLVGIGLGEPDETKNAAYGIQGKPRLRLFREGIDIMKALWTQPEAHYDGQIWQLNGIQMEPKPVQQPHPPIWFGGRHPNALRRAVRHGDAWMGAGSGSTESFKERVPQIREFLEEQGRDPASFTISKRLYIAVDDDEDRAERRMRDWFARYYNSADLAARVSVWGSREHCAEQIADLIDSGAESLLLNPVFDQIEQVEALAEITGLK